MRPLRKDKMKTYIRVWRGPRRNRKFVDPYKIGPNEYGSIRGLNVGRMKFEIIRSKSDSKESA